MYTTIDIDSIFILNVTVFRRRGTDSAAAFLHRLTEKHDLFSTVFLVDSYVYLAVVPRLGLSDQFDYSDRNLIEKWSHIFKIRVDRFHNS